MVEQSKTDNIIKITLRPNRSASWHESKLLLLLLLIPMTIIGVAWTVVGAWPVLPLVGLEFLVLCYLIYLVSYRSYQEDSIRIEGQQLTVNNGIGKKRDKQLRKVFSLQDTHLIMRQPEKPLDMPILYLSDTEKRIEIGHSLNKEDRNSLRIALIEAGLILKTI